MTTPVTPLSAKINQAVADNTIDVAEAVQLLDTLYNRDDAVTLRKLVDGVLNKTITVTREAQNAAQERYEEKTQELLEIYNDNPTGLYQCEERQTYVRWAGCAIPVGSTHVLMSREAEDGFALETIDDWQSVELGLPGGTVHEKKRPKDKDESSSCGAAREATEETGLLVSASAQPIQIYEGVYALHACRFIVPQDELLVAMAGTTIRHDATKHNDAFIQFEIHDPQELLAAHQRGEEGVYGYPEQLSGVLQSLDGR